MSSIIIKFFLGIVTTIIAHRIISIVFTLILAFLAYKYFTDPKFFNEIPSIFNKYLSDIPNMEIKKPSLKDF